MIETAKHVACLHPFHKIASCLATGGRASTRKVKHNGTSLQFDHGCQFLRVTDANVRKLVGSWEQQGMPGTSIAPILESPGQYLQPESGLVWHCTNATSPPASDSSDRLNIVSNIMTC